MCFVDDQNKQRSSDITFEGRSFTLSKIEDGKSWVKIHIMREDSNDGVLKFSAKVKSGKDLLISQIAIVE